MEWLFIWAQATDPLSNVTTIGSVTFASLLWGLIVWLCFRYLPAKDKQIEEFIKVKDEHVRLMVANCENEIATQTERFVVALKEARTDYRESLTQILAHSSERSAMLKTELDRLAQGVEHQTASIAQIRQSLESFRPRRQPPTPPG